MLRVPPLVVTATSAVPGDAPRCADSMMAPVTVSELFGLITMIFTASPPSRATPCRWSDRPLSHVESFRSPDVSQQRARRGDLALSGEVDGGRAAAVGGAHAS